MGGFAAATAVLKVADGCYAVDLDGDYGFEHALNGGYLMAVLARAAIGESAHPHPIATSASFLRTVAAGPAEVRVEPRKSGRTATVARVILAQEGQDRVEALITTGTLDGDAEPDYSVGQEKIPPIEECVTFGADNGFTRRIDLRYDPATMGWLDGRPSGVPEIRAHLRLREPYDPDGILLALAVDALPPVVLNMSASGWAPTVELTWHMRAVPAPGWLAVHGRGRLVSDGWFDEEVEVWDSTGRLVAQSRQIARVGRGRS
ncbi:thioesterase family protein [Actinoallomurus sp. CA-150999]|uniref:thioesterase family protein n=1 Tax=Actinoallomurus sp. CA-150999 TaxID=3239887 RepID=UPI003D8E4290